MGDREDMAGESWFDEEFESDHHAPDAKVSKKGILYFFASVLLAACFFCAFLELGNVSFSAGSSAPPVVGDSPEEISKARLSFLNDGGKDWLIVDMQGLDDRCLDILTEHKKVPRIVISPAKNLEGPGLGYLTGCAVEELRISNTDLKDSALDQLPILSDLTSMELHAATNVTGSGLSSLSKQPLLKKLALERLEKLTDESFSSIAENAGLESVIINHCPKITGAGVKELAKLEKLTHLDLGQCSGLDSKGLSALSECTELQVLILKKIPVGDDLTETLLSLQNLRVLDLSDTKFSRESVEKLTSNLKMLTDFDGP